MMSSSRLQHNASMSPGLQRDGMTVPCFKELLFTRELIKDANSPML